MATQTFHPFPRLLTELQAMIWSSSSLDATSCIPFGEINVDFLQKVYCDTPRADDSYIGFYSAIEFRFGRVQFEAFFGFHRLEVLRAWKDAVKDIDFAFGVWDWENGPLWMEGGIVRAWRARCGIIRRPEDDIEREIKWQQRAKKFGGVGEAVPSDLGEEFMENVVTHPDGGHESRDFKSWKTVDQGYYHAFLGVVKEEYGGGGLG